METLKSNIVNYIIRIEIICLLIIMQASVIQGQESHCQYLWLNPISQYANPGERIPISIYYDVTDNDNTLFGFGLRLFYNSSLVSFEKNDQLFNLFKPPAIMPDEDNLDGDPKTDRYLLIAWLEWNGRWPGQKLPCLLGNIHFQVLPDASVSIANINIRSTATNPGYCDVLQSAKVYIRPLTKQ